MISNELKNKSVTELNENLLALLKQQCMLRMQKGLGEDPKPHLFKQLKKQIAQVKTLINEKSRV